MLQLFSIGSYLTIYLSSAEDLITTLISFLTDNVNWENNKILADMYIVPICNNVIENEKQQLTMC